MRLLIMLITRSKLRFLTNIQRVTFFEIQASGLDYRNEKVCFDVVTNNSVTLDELIQQFSRSKLRQYLDP